jgi:hypothetical protein
VHWGVKGEALLLPSLGRRLRQRGKVPCVCRFRVSLASLQYFNSLFTDNFFLALHRHISWFYSSALRETTAYPTTTHTTVNMRAARYYGKEDVRIERDVPAPPEQLLEGQVRVQPAFVGICGTGMRYCNASNASKY